MKNLIVSFILGIILFSCYGCNPINPSIPPEVAIEQFNITTTCGSNGIINPSNLSVSSGSNVTIMIMPDEGYIVDVLKVDGKVVSSTTSLVLPNITSDKKVEATFKVKFKEGSLSWYLIQKPWYNDSIIIHETNGTWTHYALWGVPGESQEVIYYLPKGIIQAYLDGKLVGDTKWSIDETINPPVLNGGINPPLIEKLDENSLILKYREMGSDEIFCIDIYSHH